MKNEVAQELSDEWDLGRADAAVPASQVPCGGCGAALHCRDANLPGFLPADLFVGLNKKVNQKINHKKKQHKAKETHWNPF